LLCNIQVVLVGLLAWILLRERPHNSSLAAIPVVGFGVVLISGVLEQGAYGSNPKLGAVYGVLTGVAYSGFLLTLRQGSKDLRRAAGPLYTATLSSAIFCALIGLVVGTSTSHRRSPQRAGSSCTRSPRRHSAGC
jgi:drug/metabolite transporter (DMT)-like permease